MLRWLFLLFLLLAACSDPTRMVVHDPTQPKVKRPDSLRAKLEIEFRSPTESQSLTAIAMVIPDEKYRVELRALMGIPVASLLGDFETWQLLIPSENLLVKGNGPTVELPLENPVVFPMDAILPWLWGEVLPKGLKSKMGSRGKSGQILIKGECAESLPCSAEIFEGKTGSIRWEDSNAQYVHEKPSFENGFPVFRKNLLRTPKGDVTVEVNSMDVHPNFSKRTWQMRYDSTRTKIIEWYL